jgi:hypothetical protein
LRRIKDSAELEIAAVRRDGTLRASRPIWVVPAGDNLFVRAPYGEASGWHRASRASGQVRIRAGGIEKDVTIADADMGVLDQVDAAYRSKYGRYASIVDAITGPAPRASTVRLLPRP